MLDTLFGIFYASLLSSEPSSLLFQVLLCQQLFMNQWCQIFSFLLWTSSLIECLLVVSLIDFLKILTPLIQQYQSFSLTFWSSFSSCSAIYWLFFTAHLSGFSFQSVFTSSLFIHSKDFTWNLIENLSGSKVSQRALLSVASQKYWMELPQLELMVFKAHSLWEIASKLTKTKSPVLLKKQQKFGSQWG